jgi:Haemolymph juvenile hormone binding protein (JHBP)
MTISYIHATRCIRHFFRYETYFNVLNRALIHLILVLWSPSGAGITLGIINQACFFIFFFLSFSTPLRLQGTDGINDIDSIDPMRINRIKILQGDGPVSVNASLSKVVVTGFNKVKLLQNT